MWPISFSRIERAVAELASEVSESAGLAAGEAVTIGLRALPEWRAPVVDTAGRPVPSAPGVERIGDHVIEKRHLPVVGPKIEAYAGTLSDGFMKNVVSAFGRGASAAPGATYRLEAAIADWF